MTIQTNQTPPRPIKDGDVGIVLDTDGNYFAFNAHSEFDPAKLTETQLEQGGILQALLIALKYPQVMAVLKTMANDPAVVGEAG